MVSARTLGAAIAAAVLIGAASAAGAAPGERVVPLGAQTRVALTIYNSDLALVRDVRRVPLAIGANRIAFRDVSAQLRPETALLKSLSLSGGVSVVEQNFNFDLLSPQRLLEKYVGRQVTVVHTNPRTGARTAERATVLSVNDGVVLQYADRVETTVDGELRFDALPTNLRDRPTLVVDLASSVPRQQDLELDYLTGGLSWHADYVGRLDAADDRLDLNGLVTLTNDAGTTFTNATLQLLAGDVNRVSEQVTPAAAMDAVRNAATKPQFAQQNLFDYHLYTLQRPTTIADKQTKQIALLSASGVPVAKRLELRGAPDYYTQSETSSDLGRRLKVGVYVEFLNDGHGLGVPLPAGTVRMYKNDGSGRLQYVGEDAIDHTPRKEKIRLKLGDAFDVTANRKQTDFKILDAKCSCVFQSGYEIQLHNAKDVAVSVLVVEPIPGDWRIVAENYPHTKSSSDTASWTIRVPKNGAATLRYRVNVRT